MEELGIYVHIPFCRRKCIYCDFVSYPAEDAAVFASYIEGVLHEAAWYRHHLGTVRAASVYFGGGTPSLLPPDLLARLLAGLRELFPWGEGAEVTLEANPGTVGASGLAKLRGAGFNRLSMGVQSFNDRDLLALGRIHTSQEAVQAVESAREAGFENLSIDLIFALPGQTLADWETNLRQAAALGVPHLSVYNLMVEEGTPLHHLVEQGKMVLPPEEDQVGMFRRADDYLAGAGFDHYEISNYALPGYYARHNLRYWENLPYLGLGAAAWGYVQGWRYGNHPGVREYLQALDRGIMDGDLKGGTACLSPAVQEKERLTGAARWGEAMMLALRTRWGVDAAEFTRRYGVDPLTLWAGEITKLKEKGWLETSEGRIRLTPQGTLWANQVFMEFLPD